MVTAVPISMRQVRFGHAHPIMLSIQLVSYIYIAAAVGVSCGVLLAADGGVGFCFGVKNRCFYQES